MFDSIVKVHSNMPFYVNLSAKVELLVSLFVVFTTLFVVTTAIGAPLQPTNDLPDAIKEDIAIHAMLENSETGEKVFLELVLVGFQVESLDTPGSPESVTMTYEVGIPGDMLGISLNTNREQSFLLPGVAYASETKYKCDSTSSVCATLTFSYNDGFSNGQEWMYAVQVSNKWVRYDPQVTWSNGEIRAACQAWWFSKPGTCSTATYGNVSNPVSGNTYSITPTFAGSSNKTVVDDINYQIASQYIRLHRGTSHWDFYVCIVNGGGSIVYGCY